MKSKLYLYIVYDVGQREQDPILITRYLKTTIKTQNR